MTSILPSYPCWPNSGLMETVDHMLPLRNERMVVDETSPRSFTSSSTSNSPRSTDAADSTVPVEVGHSYSLPKDLLSFASPVTQAQLYALQLRNQEFLQQQMLLRQLASPVNMMASQSHVPFMSGYNGPSMVSMAANGTGNGACSSASSILSDESSLELPESVRRGKRKRSDRTALISDYRFDGDESDSESSGEKLRIKQAKLSADAVPETDLSDITELLSLPQKEAAQRLGISESMLCKRFKECTRRKWPFRFLRKIEKTIATLQAQKDIEPLSIEDQDRLEELLKQRLECLAPVKIRITKNPSPVPCSRSGHTLSESSFSLLNDAEESDSDDSDTREAEADVLEAVEKLIHLSRSTSPRSFLTVSQLAC